MSIIESIHYVTHFYIKYHIRGKHLLLFFKGRLKLIFSYSRIRQLCVIDRVSLGRFVNKYKIDRILKHQRCMSFY